MMRRPSRERPLIAFFEYADVFEDFYAHYGVDQHAFATAWADTGNHNYVRLLQREVGDVVWCCLSLAPRLAEARHERTGCRVRMVRSSLPHRLLWRLFYVPRLAWRWRRLYPLYALLASYLAPLSLPLLRALWRERPDLLLVQDYASGKFDVLLLHARLLGIPLVAYHAGSVPERYLGRALRRWTLRRADRLLVSSQAEAAMLRDRFGVDAQRVSIVLTPLDTAVYRPIDRVAACRRIGVDPQRRRLLFMGRLDDAVKRVSLVIRSFAQVIEQDPDLDLLICGAGPDATVLEHLARESAPGRVRFLGWVSDPQAKVAIYNACEALVLASVSEGFPTVVSEAMACGTPVVSSDVGGVRELVVDGESGYLFDPADTGALSLLLRRLLRDALRLDAMRRNARRSAEQRVADAIIAQRLRACLGVGVGA